jgi:hypothetical protein
MKTYQLHSHPISILTQFPALDNKLAAAGGDNGERIIVLGGDLKKAAF